MAPRPSNHLQLAVALAVLCISFQLPAAAEPPGPSINTVQCPIDSRNISANSDLATAAKDPGYTYYLEAGDYTVSSTISLPVNTTTCYIGAGTAAGQQGTSIGYGGAATFWSLQMLSNPSGANYQQLGLQGLQLQGGGQAGGAVYAFWNGDGFAPGLLVAMDGVVLRRFVGASSIGVGARAITFNGARGDISRTVFQDNTNTAVGVASGGAAWLGRSSVTFREVQFLNNTSTGSGGAIFTTSSTSLTFNGSAFKGNAGVGSGGAIAVIGGTAVKLLGALCASGNSLAPGAIGGGFAIVDTETALQFESPGAAQQVVGGNTPDTIFAVGGSSVTCGSEGAKWAKPASYNITGDVCDCNSNFTQPAPSSYSCGGCGIKVWDSDKCACKPRPCTGGPCCNGTEVLINTTCIDPSNGCTGVCTGLSGDCTGTTNCPQTCVPGSICRHEAGPCDKAEVCTAAGTCPPDRYAIGKLCRRAEGPCLPDRVCSGAGVECPKRVAVNGKPCPFSTQDATAQGLTQPAATNPAYNPFTNDDYGDDEAEYAHGSREHEASYYRTHWPKCEGRCFAGQCRLEKDRPGCCYTEADGAYAAHEYGSDGSSTDDNDAGLQYFRFEGRDERRSSSSSLVCWRDGGDAYGPPEYVVGGRY